MSFSYSALNDKLPAGSLTETADDVMISLKALTNSLSLQLSDTNIADAIHDLLAGCALAEDDYNASNPTATINTFNNPLFTAPTRRNDGSVRSNATFTVVTSTPLNFSATVANS